MPVPPHPRSGNLELGEREQSGPAVGSTVFTRGDLLVGESQPRTLALVAVFGAGHAEDAQLLVGARGGDGLLAGPVAPELTLVEDRHVLGGVSLGTVVEHLPGEFAGVAAAGATYDEFVAATA